MFGIYDLPAVYRRILAQRMFDVDKMRWPAAAFF